MLKRIVIALNQVLSVKEAIIMPFQRRQELPFPVHQNRARQGESQQEENGCSASSSTEEND